MKRRTLLAAALGLGAAAAAPMAAFMPRYVPFVAGSKSVRTGDTLRCYFHKRDGTVVNCDFVATKPGVYVGAFLDQRGRIVPVRAS